MKKEEDNLARERIDRASRERSDRAGVGVGGWLVGCGRVAGRVGKVAGSPTVGTFGISGIKNCCFNAF